MVINKILRQITLERVKKENEEIRKIELPAEIEKWIKEYEKLGERNKYLWKWMYKSVQVITSPTVHGKYKKSLWVVKTLIIMFITLLDDIADKTRNKTLLNELLKIPLAQADIKLNRLNRKERRYVVSAIGLWNHIMKTIRTYPRYPEFKDLFEYDMVPVMDEMKYSFLVNKNIYLINRIEYWLFLPYNMQSFVSYTVDLMCSPSFKIKDLRVLREIIWFLQKMAKIGNWLSTWERELREKDFTSGIFAEALDSGTLKTNKLAPQKTSIIAQKIKNAKTERILFKEWEKCYNEIKELNKKIKITNKKEILSGAEKFLILHLINKGNI